MPSRALLCSVVLALLLTSASAAAQDDAVRLQRAYERMDEFVARHMREAGTPGLALAVTSREGLLRVATYGFADLKARTPVTPETLFEIGSISKSFTAIALLQLREEGRFDPQAPITRHLPWFQIQSDYEPITAHHLLTHTAGIPRDRDDIPSSVYQAVALRERETAYPPGLKSSYSNIGFQVLGYLLEEVTGEDYGAVIRQRILEPLRMTATEPVITHDTRRRLATGYKPFYDDRPAHRSHGLVEGTWIEYGAGDGSISATPADLAAYLRMLLNRGAVPEGRILSEESFRLLTQRTIRAHENEYSGYGLGIREVDGRTIVWHGGGMIGYASMLLGDLDEGLGAVVFVNGPGDPGRVAQFALAAVRAALRGDELPPVPEPESPTRTENASDYAGIFIAPDGRRWVFEAKAERLLLVRGSERIALEPRGTDRFYVPHPDFSLYLLRFGRDAKEQVVEASFGSAWFTHESYAGPREFDVPALWHAYTGHYRAAQSWLSNFRVVLRKGRLWIALPPGGEEELVELGPGLFQVGTEETAERLRLDTVVEGKALRANFSGVDFYRSFTP